MSASAPIRHFENFHPRIAFAHEAQSFTRWLEDHLDQLSDAIGVPLKLLHAKAIGKRQIADILARDERDGSAVIVENQLGPSDDSHLGQILTYLGGVDARAVVWITTSFNESHRRAARWFNVKGPIKFFAVQVRLIRMADLELACAFDVVEGPYDWDEQRRAAAVGEARKVGGFAAGFWARHLAGYPDEERRSRPEGPLCRWRRVKQTRLVVGQLLQRHSVSVFVRGGRGAMIQEVMAMLAPHAPLLESWFGVALDTGHPDLLAVKTLEINLTDVANWAAASEWLRTHTDAYEAALKALGLGTKR